MEKMDVLSEYYFAIVMDRAYKVNLLTNCIQCTCICEKVCMTWTVMNIGLMFHV